MRGCLPQGDASKPAESPSPRIGLVGASMLDMTPMSPFSLSTTPRSSCDVSPTSCQSASEGSACTGTPAGSVAESKHVAAGACLAARRRWGTGTAAGSSPRWEVAAAGASRTTRRRPAAGGVSAVPSPPRRSAAALTNWAPTTGYLRRPAAAANCTPRRRWAQAGMRRQCTRSQGMRTHSRFDPSSAPSA